MLDSDNWVLKEPLALLPATQQLYPSWQRFAMEKNWMPFVHRVGCVKQKRQAELKECCSSKCLAVDGVRGSKMAPIVIQAAGAESALCTCPLGICVQDDAGSEHLYVTYTVQPHMVFEVLPSGKSVHR